MAHQHPQGGCRPIQIPNTARFGDRIGQRRICNQNPMPLLSKVPGGAGADNTGTDHGNGRSQLRACAGITCS